MSTPESKKRGRGEASPRGRRVRAKQARGARDCEPEAVAVSVWRMPRARKRVAREEEEGWAESD